MTDTTYQIAGVWFPYEAAAILKDWSAQKNAYIHTVTGDIPKVVRCKNCNDLGNVHLRLSRGHYANPLPGKPITFFDSEWHVIAEMRSFVCPVCAGKGALRSVRPSTREEAQTVVDDLPGAGELVDDWTDV